MRDYGGFGEDMACEMLLQLDKSEPIVGDILLQLDKTKKKNYGKYLDISCTQ